MERSDNGYVVVASSRFATTTAVTEEMTVVISTSVAVVPIDPNEVIVVEYGVVVATVVKAVEVIVEVETEVTGATGYFDEQYEIAGAYVDRGRKRLYGLLEHMLAGAASDTWSPVMKRRMKDHMLAWMLA